MKTVTIRSQHDSRRIEVDGTLEIRPFDRLPVLHDRVIEFEERLPEIVFASESIQIEDTWFAG